MPLSHLTLDEEIDQNLTPAGDRAGGCYIGVGPPVFIPKYYNVLYTQFVPLTFVQFKSADDHVDR